MSRVANRSCLLLGCVLLLAGCAAPRPWLSDQLAAGAMGETSELATTPFFPQREYQCGPAALATVLVASGVATTPDALVERVYLPGRQGSLQAELVAATRGHARVPYRVPGSSEAIAGALRDGHPVLVLLNLGTDWLPVWHYAVVIGLDPGADTVILRSGIERRRVMDARRFASAWDRAGRWGLLVLRPDRVPSSAHADRWLQAAAGLEAVGRLDAAEKAYRASLVRWPEQAQARLGLGNVQFLGGRHEEAAASYRAYLDVEPDSAAAWNNLASAQLAAGDLGGARRSLARAEGLPASPAVAEILVSTRREIEQAARGPADHGS